MSISAFFERLGAPLRNPRWSWGAVSPSGRVFLRVWQDETRTIGGKPFIRLVNHAAYADEMDNLGYIERLGHLEAISSGAVGLGVLCIANDVFARPRSIRSFDARSVLRLGEIRVFDGDEWAEIAARPLVREIENF